MYHHSIWMFLFCCALSACGTLDPQWNCTQPGSAEDPEGDGAEEGQDSGFRSFWNCLQGQCEWVCVCMYYNPFIKMHPFLNILFEHQTPMIQWGDTWSWPFFPFAVLLIDQESFSYTNENKHFSFTSVFLTDMSLRLPMDLKQKEMFTAFGKIEHTIARHGENHCINTQQLKDFPQNNCEQTCLLFYSYIVLSLPTHTFPDLRPVPCSRWADLISH